MKFQTKVRLLSTEVPQLRSTKVLPETVDPGRVRRATYSTVQIKCVLKSQLGVNYGAGLNIVGASSPESLSML